MFKDILKELREDAGLTQIDIANLFNISRTAISKYENGEREPNIEFLIKLASYFRVSVDYLIGTTEISKPFYKLEDMDKLSPKSIAKLNKILSECISNEKLIDFIYDIIASTEKLMK